MLSLVPYWITCGVRDETQPSPLSVPSPWVPWTAVGRTALACMVPHCLHETTKLDRLSESLWHGPPRTLACGARALSGPSGRRGSHVLCLVVSDTGLGHADLVLRMFYSTLHSLVSTVYWNILRQMYADTYTVSWTRTHMRVCLWQSPVLTSCTTLGERVQWIVKTDRTRSCVCTGHCHSHGSPRLQVTER